MNISLHLRIELLSLAFAIPFYNFYSPLDDQSKFSPVGIEISLKSDYYHPPTHPHPPGKVEMQLESHHIWSVGSWWIVCLVIFGGRG